MRYLTTFLIAIVLTLNLFSQENYKTISKADSAKYYTGKNHYEVKDFKEPVKGKPKNVILFIGDGMGVAQVYSGITANNGKLYINNFKNIGLQTTYSGTHYVTDSGAGGTALSTGTKTYNGAIGVDMDSVAIENIREKCEKLGMATGVVSTSAITHATPASFVAHQKSRNYYEAIAADFLKTDIDVFIGGGYKHFTQRADGKDLTTELKAKGYTVARTIEETQKIKEGKLAALLNPEHMPEVINGRGEELTIATKTAIDILDNDKDGFFIMIEGSQIDWGGHQNNTTYIVTEMLDLDKAIGEALEFAAKDKETLVILTADHETGGFSINNGDFGTGEVEGNFTTGDHTGIMVPVFAFGPGAELFRGIYNNTDIPKKIMSLLK